MGTDPEKLLEFMKELAVDAGLLAEKVRKDPLYMVDHKETAFDLVTTADKEVEKLIVSRITQQYPSHSILGEESGLTEKESSFQWVIDPIDGTTSFVHESPNYSISIALEFEGKGLIGVVYAPVFKELFYAMENTGAYCNGKKIHVTDHNTLSGSLVATGFACLRAGWKDNNLPYFNAIAPLVRDIRRYGSAAIDFCWVACGRLDAYWELNLQKYDYAAGEVILREAGGLCTDLYGGTDTAHKGTLASNKALAPSLLPFFTGYKATRK
ncbi:MAG: inositol monophosphatase [Lentisphaeria bacterium]|nr:inositol monophosphatase [Lentisphaeria bacterium]